MQQIRRGTLTPKCDFNKYVFLWNMEKFWEHLFLQNNFYNYFYNLRWLFLELNMTFVKIKDNDTWKIKQQALGIIRN